MSYKTAMNRNQRIGVFVDVQNLYYSARSLHHAKINFEKLLEIIVADRILIRAIAYVVQKSDVDQKLFLESLERLGYELKKKELRVRADGTAKGDWDMGIAIDTISLCDKLDTIILVSGDGDFVPLVEMVKAKGCRVEVVSFAKSTCKDLIDAATDYTAIEESMLFMEKKMRRENKQKRKHNYQTREQGIHSPEKQYTTAPGHSTDSLL